MHVTRERVARCVHVVSLEMKKKVTMWNHADNPSKIQDGSNDRKN